MTRTKADLSEIEKIRIKLQLCLEDEDKQHSILEYSKEYPIISNYGQKLNTELAAYTSVLEKGSARKRGKWQEIYGEKTANMIENMIQFQLKGYLDYYADLVGMSEQTGDEFIDEKYRTLTQINDIMRLYNEFSYFKTNPFFIQDMLANYGFQVQKRGFDYIIVAPEKLNVALSPTTHWLINGSKLKNADEISKWDIDTSINQKNVNKEQE